MYRSLYGLFAGMYAAWKSTFCMLPWLQTVQNRGMQGHKVVPGVGQSSGYLDLFPTVSTGCAY